MTYKDKQKFVFVHRDTCDITKTNKNVITKTVQRHYKDKQKCTETLQRQTKTYRDITKTKKCTETLQRQTKMYRDTTNQAQMSRDI